MVHWRRAWQTTSVFLPWEDHEHSSFNWLHKKTCDKNLPRRQASLTCPRQLLKSSCINKATSYLSKKRIYHIKGNFCFVYKPNNELWELSMNLSTMNQLFRFNQRPLDTLMMNGRSSQILPPQNLPCSPGPLWSQDWHLGWKLQHPREVIGSLRPT